MESKLDMLLVDDSPADVALFQRALKRLTLNICLRTLATGDEAVAYLEARGVYADRARHPLPDVIVLDLRMPGFSGFDLLAWRLASRLFLAIPVVVLSGLGTEADLKRVFELGADKHVLKPGAAEDWESVAKEIHDFATEFTLQESNRI